MDTSSERKRIAKKRALILAPIGLVLIAVAWYLVKTASLSFEKVASLGTSIEQVASSGMPDAGFMARPLRSSGMAKNSEALSRSGIIAETNMQRESSTLSALSENPLLDDIASLRLDDMFEKQYFAHISPASSSVITVAATVGYDNLSIGENLAMGFFKGDKGVVEAWMGSPGHRENILSTHYTEIGVAAREGTFDGKPTWIAVQVFGRPSSDCPSPDPAAKAAIDAMTSSTAQMSAQLQSESQSIKAMVPQSGPAYNDQVESYNSLAEQYNELVAQAKAAITAYNMNIDAYNACLQK